MASDARSTTHTAPGGERPNGRWRPVADNGVFPVTLALLAFLLVNTQRGAVSDRIRNPEVTGAPRPATYLFGISIAFEVMLVSQGQYVFAQVIPWGPVFSG